MNILLASANQHKVREFRSIFTGHRVLTPPELGLDFDYEETGDTFFANAFGKAETLFQLFQLHRESAARESTTASADLNGDQLAVIADDSGICVDALDGGPGVYSARFGRNEGARSDEDRTRLLLQKMEGVEERGAHYVCCMVAVTGVDRFLCAQETWHGRIAHARSNGSGGFGYDPVFLLPERGVTVADISNEEKHAQSHRGKAARTLFRLLTHAGVPAM